MIKTMSRIWKSRFNLTILSPVTSMEELVRKGTFIDKNENARNQYDNTTNWRERSHRGCYNHISHFKFE